MKKSNFRHMSKMDQPISTRKHFEWLEINIDNKRIVFEERVNDREEVEVIITSFDGESGTVLKSNHFFELMQYYNKLKENKIYK